MLFSKFLTNVERLDSFIKKNFILNMVNILSWGSVAKFPQIASRDSAVYTNTLVAIPIIKKCPDKRKDKKNDELVDTDGIRKILFGVTK